MLKNVYHTLLKNPKHMFFVDGLGALISAFFLGVPMVHFNEYIGIPIRALYGLATLALVFLVYDLFCLFFLKEGQSKYLYIIAGVNMGYCLLSVGVAIFHRSSLTFWAWLYIIVEIVLISFIVNLEIKLAKQINSNKAY